MSKPVIVEFLGLPGLGKSTLANRVQASLIDSTYVVGNRIDVQNWYRDQPYASRFSLCLRKIGWSFRYWWQAVRFARSLNALDSAGWARVFRAPLLELYLRQFLRIHPVNALVLDEWSLQNLWSVGAFSTGFDSGLLRHMARLPVVAFPRCYVYLNAPLEVAARRIARRSDGNSRFDTVDKANLPLLLEKAAPLMAELTQVVQQYQADRLLTIDAEQTLDEKVACVIDFMVRQGLNKK
jgi:hypothetical protein